MVRLLAFVVLLAVSAGLAAWLVGAKPRSAPPSSPSTPAPELIPSAKGPAIATAAPPDLEREGPFAHPLSDALCPSGMAFVSGPRCPAVRHRCLEKANEGGCARFARAPCEGEIEPARFCIDLYEYPNLPQVAPAAMVTFEQAESACRAEGKRLCTPAEWSQACEGTDHRPYPYGFDLVFAACNVGASLPSLNAPKPWKAARVSRLFARLDRRETSGGSSGCISEYGVHDLNGNLAEWVRSEEPDSDFGLLVGGDFAGPPVHCRAQKKLTMRHYRGLGIGFRCCADPLVDLPRNGAGAPTGKVAPSSGFD